MTLHSEHQGEVFWSCCHNHSSHSALSVFQIVHILLCLETFVHPIYDFRMLSPLPLQVKNYHLSRPWPNDPSVVRTLLNSWGTANCFPLWPSELSVSQLTCWQVNLPPSLLFPEGRAHAISHSSLTSSAEDKVWYLSVLCKYLLNK